MAFKVSIPKFFLFATAALPVLSCGKLNESDIVPAISYSGFEKHADTTGKDSIVVIKFTYKDDDGDLGYYEDQTSYPFALNDPYFYNLHCEFYEMENGQKKYLTDPGGDTIRYDQRLRSLTPEGKHKGISGQMDLRVDFILVKISGHNPDSVKMELWLNDRALHHSNIIVTPIIPLNL